MSHKRILFSAVLLFAFITTIHAKIVHLLPRPQKITVGTGSLSFPEKIRFNATQSDRINAAFTNMLGVQVTDEASATLVTINVGKSISGSYNYTLNGYDNEAYKLVVASDGITIDAVREIGVIRAVQTLMQMAEGYDGAASLECCTITDWPAFKLRGLMHDIGRSFISFEELKKQIKLMARFKVNTFHWHLTENQGWRFEVKKYPQLTKASSMTRFAGKYYTQDQCRELEELAYQYGITIIPEIDMPGHSEAFRQAMGHDMQTDQGVEELKEILTEVGKVFTRAPYIHIGADEVAITYPNFLKIMTDHIHNQLKKKVVFWNPIRNVAINTSTGADMTQMWSSSGKVITGMPNIDCRYNYINHFDIFADVVGIYKSNIYYTQRGTNDVAGTITAVWNDRYIVKESDIMLENNVYANLLASAERAWIGGGKQYIEVGGTTLPLSGEEFDEFADWERRFLFHKANSLKDEPIPYVKQTNVRWQITDAFPNGGNSATVLPPETLGPQSSYSYQGQTYGTGPAIGAGIYLRHVWGTTVPSYFANPQINTTAYAWTYVYSPVEQQAGAIIEFQNYSRSETDAIPADYSWDRKGSRIWFNDTEIKGPKWDNTGVSIGKETPLKNENAVRRKPVTINLKQGWNKVFMKLPYVNVSGVRLNKWMFTFVITDKDGKNALEDLIYSPDQNFDENANGLTARISEINGFLAKAIGTDPGFYSEELAQTLCSLIEQIKATFSETMSASERNQQLQQLNEAFDSFQANGLILPKASTDSKEYWYNFCSTLRGSRYTQSNGTGSGLTGNANNSTGDNVQWKFVLRSDGTYDIINRADGSYISPSATYNTQITTSATRPLKGWTLKASGTLGMLIITCGDVQLNQTNVSDKIYNWSSQSMLGNDTKDDGCQFTIREYLSPETKAVKEKIEAIHFSLAELIGTEPGFYSEELAQPLRSLTEQIKATLSETLSQEERNQQLQQLNEAFDSFQANGLILPKASTDIEEYWYNFCSTLRGSRYTQSNGTGSGLTGNANNATGNNVQWKFVLRSDGTYDIINRADGSYISPSAAYNKQISTSATQPSKGWTLKASGTIGMLIITCGDVQLNQTDLNDKIYNWSSNRDGNDTKDDGCQFTIRQVVSSIPMAIEKNFSEEIFPDNTTIYDLQGRRVQGNSTLPKGIYIRGNKKFVVK